MAHGPARVERRTISKKALRTLQQCRCELGFGLASWRPSPRSFCRVRFSPNPTKLQLSQLNSAATPTISVALRELFWVMIIIVAGSLQGGTS